MTIEISRDEARHYLVGQLGLRRMRRSKGARGVRGLLAELRCIQLDPLDRIGSNADLVALARVDGLRRGEVYDYLMPGHAFEHFAKKLCLLPDSALPYYLERMRGEGYRYRWHGFLELPEGAAGEVLAEIRKRGPVTPGQLTDRGHLKPPKNKWLPEKLSVNAIAVELLWSRCQVVVCGRTANTKLYDVPERALPEAAATKPAVEFDRWALEERVEAAGLLPLTAGPQWSVLERTRTSPLRMELVEDGVLELVTIAASKRRHLAPAGFRDRKFPDDDARMRILGPLDPLLWDRRLVKELFGFDYVWEVYKPKAQRVWGYYVCPILHRGRLVGRFEGHRVDGRVEVERLWVEEGADFDTAAWDEALERLRQAQ